MINARLHRKRIMSELREAGITSWGMLKLETRKLPQIIHEDEEIGGIAYGRTTGDKVGSAMLIATNKRILFLDAKPFFTTSDEIAYRVVSGVKINSVGPFSSVTLHTRIRDYGLRFVNQRCARIFETFIETFIELHKSGGSDIYDNVNDMTPEEVHNNSAPTPKKLKIDEFIDFASNLNTAVLSTVNKSGEAHGAVVHYVFKNGIFYIVTKALTLKAKDVFAHPQVALTIQNPNGLKTAQVTGVAEKEENSDLKAEIYRIISEPKQYAEGVHFPPILSMNKGNIVILRITPTDLQYQDFSTNNW